MLFLNLYFEMQSELDAKIWKRAGIDPHLEPDFWGKLVTALQVEINECCNSWRGFKYWSQNQTPKHDTLEEYVDGLHFFLSMGNLINTSTFAPSFPSGPDVLPPLQGFALVNKLVNMLHQDDHYALAFQAFLDLGYSLGFTWPQITDAYREKLKVNHQRQADGY
jgi:dimeric dUTPase (all-alpha-NTP-PPase superfamily)